jgi:predicted lipoprotein
MRIFRRFTDNLRDRRQAWRSTPAVHAMRDVLLGTQALAHRCTHFALLVVVSLAVLVGVGAVASASAEETAPRTAAQWRSAAVAASLVATSPVATSPLVSLSPRRPS